MAISNDTMQRFRFIGEALRGDGPFRPRVSNSGTSSPSLVGTSYLCRYSRESDVKFAGRNDVAFYASPLAQACSRFIGYLTMHPPSRDVSAHELYAKMADDIDGKGNSLEAFMQQFGTEAKARGSMLLLVDMPPEFGSDMASQIANRGAPTWLPYAPEQLTDYQIGDDGKFDYVEFEGKIELKDMGREDVLWHFDRAEWWARKLQADGKGAILATATHHLGECPMIAFTEAGDFPSFGPFAAIADVSRRMFNVDSEIDESMRAQGFSILALNVPDDTSNEAKLALASTAGVTVSTSNMLAYSGNAPSFIAPPDGPVSQGMKRLEDLQNRINEIGLNVATVNQAESGIAMQMRFQAVNAALSSFAARLEDFERRAWDLSRIWLKMQNAPNVQWPRDFDIADVEVEMKILADMISSGMPQEIIIEQRRRVVSVQFAGLNQERQDAMTAALDEMAQGAAGTGASGGGQPGGNVLQLPDRNAAVRAAIVANLGANNGG